MKHCNNCKVDVSTDENYCPICYSYLTVGEGQEFPLYLKRTNETKISLGASFVLKLFVFISICIAVICGAIDYMLISKFTWSLVVCASVLYAWVIVGHTIISSRSIFEKILFQLCALFVLLLSLNNISKGSWLIDYVLPSIMLASSVGMAIILIASPLRKNYLLTFLVFYILFAIVSLLVVCLAPEFFSLLHIVNTITNGLMAIGTLIFGFGRIKSDISKIMHL